MKRDYDKTATFYKTGNYLRLLRVTNASATQDAVCFYFLSEAFKMKKACPKCKSIPANVPGTDKILRLILQKTHPNLSLNDHLKGHFS